MADLLFPLQFLRQFAAPLDADGAFATAVDLNAYLTNARRYAGQLVSCAETPDVVYVLNAARNAWLPVASFVDATATVYVSKVGVDADSGLTPAVPKLTIGAAITAASALLLAGATGVLIQLMDGETYTENLTIAAGMTLNGPGATLVGTLTLESNTSVVLDKHYASANNQDLVQKSGGTGYGFYRANVLDGRGLAGAFTGNTGLRNVSNGSVIFAQVGVHFVSASGVGVQDSGAGFGHIHFWTPDLYLAGNNAIGVQAQNNSNFIGYIDHILEIGGPAGTVAFSLTNAGAIVKATVTEIIVDQAWNITNGSLYLNTPKVTTTIASVGTPLFLTASLYGVQTFSGAQRGVITTLVDAATITPDFAVNNSFAVTVAGSRTLANPANMLAAGVSQSGSISITIGGAGGYTLAYGSYWNFPNGALPILSTTVGAKDLLVYNVVSATDIQAQLVNGFS